MKAKNTLCFLLLSMFIAGCAKHQVPITKRNQLMLLSKNDELKIGRKNFHVMINKSNISKDEEKMEMLNRVGRQLTSTIKNKKLNWEFVLIENDSINASCFPGGKVIVNTGVFKVAKTDAQLATILSHEIAHAISRHGSARISRNRILNGIEGAGVLLTGLLNPLMIIPFIMSYEVGTKNGIINPAIRIEENEADIIGLHLMKKANYDLSEALDFWNNLKMHNNRKKHMTHASYNTRITNIKRTIAKLNKKMNNDLKQGS
ncbi:MAG: M48 family metallopeptidase [Campylobacteraceae bacterium]|nr:M48 family metallopeptidase [Campylobacteraceae bacterium]